MNCKLLSKTNTGCGAKKLPHVCCHLLTNVYKTNVKPIHAERDMCARAKISM